MPITVACGACSTKLTAPDSAAGKRVKCPKCAALLELPAADPGFEVVDDGPAAVPAAAKSAPARALPTPAAKSKPRIDLDDEDEVDDDRSIRRRRSLRDDDEDDEDDRPSRRRPAPRDDDEDDGDDDRPARRRPARGKRRAKKKKKSALPLILTLVGALLVLGVVGGVVAFLMAPDGSSPSPTVGGGGGNGEFAAGPFGGPNGPPPVVGTMGGPQPGPLPKLGEIDPGWIEVSQPEFTVRMHSDKPPDNVLGAGGNRIGAVKNALRGNKLFGVSSPDKQSGQLILLAPLDASDQIAARRNLKQFLDTSFSNLSTREFAKSDAQIGGLAGRGYAFTDGKESTFGRAVVANNRLYVLIAGGPGMTEQSDHVKKYFDSFRVK